MQTPQAPPWFAGIRPAVAVSLLLALGACQPAPPPEIRIGLLATYTGEFAEISGTPTLNGARLAVEDAGPITFGGRPWHVTLVPRDFADRADAAANAARALINQNQVHALIGPQFSRHAIPVAVLADDARIPMISPMSSNPATTAGHRYVFRLAFLDDVQGDVLARFAAQDLQARSAAVLYDVSTAYSHDLAERFRAAFTAAGGRVVAFESYTADRATDFHIQVGRIAAARPDAVFLPNFPDAVKNQVAQLQQAGIRASLLGGDSWDPQTLPPLTAGVAAYVTNQWRPDIPTAPARRFTTRYRAAYGAEPRATAAMTYDAVTVLLDAIRGSGSLNADTIRAALAATADFAGATGTITFGGINDPRRAVAVSRVRGGGLETVRLVEP